MQGGTRSPTEMGSDFGSWLAAREPALHRLATLLTGDEVAGRDLALPALARLRLAWRGLDPLDADDRARALLLEEHRRAWGRHGADPEPAVPPGGYADGDAAAWALVRSLPGRTRAVVVLRLHQDLDERETADLVRLSPQGVRLDETAVATALRVHLDKERSRHPERPWPGDPATLLARTLRDHGEATSYLGCDPDEIDAAADALRSRRRTRLTVGLVAARRRRRGRRRGGDRPRRAAPASGHRRARHPSPRSARSARSPPTRHRPCPTSSATSSSPPARSGSCRRPSALGDAVPRRPLGHRPLLRRLRHAAPHRRERPADREVGHQRRSRAQRRRPDARVGRAARHAQRHPPRRGPAASRRAGLAGRSARRPGRLQRDPRGRRLDHRPGVPAPSHPRTGIGARGRPSDGSRLGHGDQRGRRGRRRADRRALAWRSDVWRPEAFSPDGKHVVAFSTTRGEVVQHAILDAERGQPVTLIPSPFAGILDLRWEDHAHVLLLATDQGQSSILRVDLERPAHRGDAARCPATWWAVRRTSSPCADPTTGCGVRSSAQGWGHGGARGRPRHHVPDVGGVARGRPAPDRLPAHRRPRDGAAPGPRRARRGPGHATGGPGGPRRRPRCGPC